MEKIGSLKLKNRIFLAPMTEINDIAFRILCKKAGAGLTYTGMVNPLSKEELILEDNPAIQLFSINEKGIPEFIKNHEAVLFDFNLGCPAKTAREHGFGFFLQDLKVVEKILETMRKSTDKPITIKLRKSRNAKKIIKIAEKHCDAICLHPRTQNQGYSGTPDIRFAEKIKEKTSIPIIYSGNVDEKNSDEMLEKFDFVMIGRRAIGNPGVFGEITGSKINPEFKDYLELAFKHHLKFAQIKLQAMNFTKGRENAVEMRRDLIKARAVKDIKKIYGINQGF